MDEIKSLDQLLNIIRSNTHGHWLDGSSGKLAYVNIPAIGGMYVRFNAGSTPDILDESVVAESISKYRSNPDNTRATRDEEVANAFDTIIGKQPSTLIDELHAELGIDDYKAPSIQDDCVYVFEPKCSDLQPVYCVVDSNKLVHIAHDEMLSALEGIDTDDWSLFGKVISAVLRKSRLKVLEDIVSRDSAYSYTTYVEDTTDPALTVVNLYSAPGRDQQHAVLVFTQSAEFVLLTDDLFKDILRVNPDVFSTFSVKDTYISAAEFIYQRMQLVKELTGNDIVNLMYANPNLYYTVNHYVLFNADGRPIVRSAGAIRLIQNAAAELGLTDCKTEQERLIAAMTAGSEA